MEKLTDQAPKLNSLPKSFKSHLKIAIFPESFLQNKQVGGA